MSQEKHTKFNAQISEEAAAWFVEFRLGEVDAPGRREFDAWIRTSPEHLRAYLETAALWNESDSLAAHRDLDSEALIALARMEGNIIPLGLERSQAPQTPQAPAPQTPQTPQTPHRAQVPVSPPPRTLRRWLFPLAAALALVLVGGGLSILWQLGHDAVYATAVGERRTIRLEDRSTVELNSRSRIRISFSQSQRNVELLEGQALFHVAKDTRRPFTVRSDRLLVRAVGTLFDVNRKTSSTTVTVVEGRVAVGRAGTSGPVEATPYASPPQSPGSQGSASLTSPRSEASNSSTAAAVVGPRPSDNSVSGADVTSPSSDAPGSAAVFLSAGEQLTVGDQTPPLQPQHASPTVATAWTQGQLVLESATLADLAEEFNRYSTRRIVIEDRGEPLLRLSGVFATDPEFLLQSLRQRRDITVVETPTEVRITRHD